MRKIFTFILAAFCGLAVQAQDLEFNFTGSTLPTGWTASNKGSSSYEGISGNVLKVSNNGVITYVFETPVNLQSVDFAFAFKSKDDVHANVVVKDASDSELGSAELKNTAASGVKEEANLPLAYDGVKTFIITNVAGKDFLLSYVKFNVQTCTAPAKPLVLKADKTTEIYVADVVTFSTEGGNESTVTIKGKNGETLADSKWTAEAGEHIFVASQEKNGDVCAQEVELKLNVATKDKVTKAEIKGSSSTYIGKEVTLTCEAANAANWQWYKGEAKIDGANAAEYKFTPDAAGELSFTCEAWNKFNSDADHAKSAAFKVTVAEALCGVLARIEVISASEAKLTGEFAGTANVKNLDGTKAQNRSEYDGKTGYKLYKQGSYIGADFTDGTLKAKDKVIVFVTTESAKMQIFADKEGSKLLLETESIVKGENVYVLGDEAEGATGLYAVRMLGGDEGAKYNPHIAYIELKRPCHEESNDASIKSLSMNGNVIEAKDKLYAFEVAADYDSTNPVEIKFELNDSKAKADHESPFKLLAPEKSSDTIRAEINVTAEDGTKAQYKIEITRAEAPKSTDASITELKINNEIIPEDKGVFAYEVAAEAALDSVEVSFTLADKAIAEPASPFKVLVPEAGAGASEKAIKVTAEDGTTTKEYKVSVTKAKKAEEGLDNVTDGVKVVKYFENGQFVIIKNGVKYNAQGAIMK